MQINKSFVELGRTMNYKYLTIAALALMLVAATVFATIGGAFAQPQRRTFDFDFIPQSLFFDDSLIIHNTGSQIFQDDGDDDDDDDDAPRSTFEFIHNTGSQIFQPFELPLDP